MTREEQQDIINTLKEMYGIHAIWFWGIRDLVRLQFNKNHLEFIEFDKLIDRVLIHFEEEFLKRQGQIGDLQSLPYIHVHVGTMEKPVQKSFVALSDVINLLNFRRKEFVEFNKNIKTLKQKNG